MKRKMSIGARIWISFCMVACVGALVFLFVTLLANNGAVASEGGKTLAWLIVSIVACFLFLAGYAVLMFCKKGAFFFVMAVAFAYAAFSLIVSMPLPAYISLIHPAVTLLFIRPCWDRWQRDAARQAEVKRESAQPKRRKTALILAALPWTGIFGVDRFYLGYVGLGLLKLFTAGGCLVLYIVDIVKIAKGTMLDRWGRPLV